MSIRLPSIWFGNLKQAVRDLATIVGQMLKDDPKPPRWDDVWMLGNAIASGTFPKAPAFDDAEYAYRFTNSATNVFAGCIQMPHRMRIDGPDPIIGYPHLHIYTRTAVTSTASGKHVWRLRWRWYDAVGVQTATWNVRTVTHTASRTGHMAIASFGEVTASYTLGVSSLFKFELARLPPGNKVAVYVDQADTHVQFDVDRGSHLETSKWER